MGKCAADGPGCWVPTSDFGTWGAGRHTRMGAARRRRSPNKSRESLGPGQATLTLRNISSIARSDIPAIRALIRERPESSRYCDCERRERQHNPHYAQPERSRAAVGGGDRRRQRDAGWSWSRRARDLRQAAAIADYMTLAPGAAAHLSQFAPGAVSDDPFWPHWKPLMLTHHSSAGGHRLFAFAEGGWQHEKYFPLNEHRQLTRDPRGILLPAPDGTASRLLPASRNARARMRPTATSRAIRPIGWTIHCHESDEPWPITQPIGSQASTATTEKFALFR